MGVVQIRVEVCDVCQDQAKPVDHFRVALPGERLRSVALCADDRVPLIELLDRVSATATQSRRMRHPFTDMSAVEAARKKAPAKKAARKKSG